MESRKIPINSDRAEEAKSGQESFRVVDKRPTFQEDAAVPPAETKPRYPSFVEELMARMTETERRFAERVKQVDQEIARTKARLEAEFERKLDRGKQDLLLPFLEVLDNLERALKAASAGEKNELVEGLDLTAAMFRAKLRNQAIERIDVVDQAFDPNTSQAVGVVPVADPAKDGVVVDELLPGYKMGDNLVRPAHVRVGRYEP